MNRKEGRLFYNPASDRMDIFFEDGTTDGGLHCGETMDVKIKGEWVPTRIEKSDFWYLIGVKEELFGLRVRI